jgi:hypothetical protein
MHRSRDAALYFQEEGARTVGDDEKVAKESYGSEHGRLLLPDGCSGSGGNESNCPPDLRLIWFSALKPSGTSPQKTGLPSWKNIRNAMFSRLGCPHYLSSILCSLEDVT